MTIARFLLYKSRTSKFSTVNNYFSAIVALHRYHGFEDDYRSTYFMKLLMEGLRHRLGDAVRQAESLSVPQLKAMAEFVDHSDWKKFMLWCSIGLSFRSLLRKSNILPDKASEIGDHVVRFRHVKWTSYGCCLDVVSTKTIQCKEQVLRIPITRVSGSKLCAVHYIEKSLAFAKPSLDSPIFVCHGKPILYREGLAFIKHLVSCIGLDSSKVGFHSLRRSGAMYMNSLGVALPDIKSAGDWRSMAVLTYLISGHDRKVEIDQFVASKLVED